MCGRERELVGFVVLEEGLVDVAGAEDEDDAGADLDEGEGGAGEEGLTKALLPVAVVALAMHV
eukprot:CAMPEP_0177785588 /NCGR_PEP_ID=MMETSP0491_2-20121128/20421_1 /TAXON_ID=63592 /ORGANISM="Tetraselmis chuii, Strain PLY429" /LENGTH=62 /DNA_ID=CAMNT_0019306645 /DNA_START=58 /DNA_END=243 /DNA_ORIENTATION=-